MNWMRAKLRSSTCANDRATSVFAEAGVVLDQHVAVGQDREQHDLELGPLADNGALHLVEHGRRSRADLLERQVAGHRAAPICSIAGDGASGCRRSVAPGPWRSPGGGRSARTSLPRLRPEGRLGRLGVAVEVDARRGEAVTGDVLEERAQPLVHGHRHCPGRAPPGVPSRAGPWDEASRRASAIAGGASGARVAEAPPRAPRPRRRGCRSRRSLDTLRCDGLDGVDGLGLHPPVDRVRAETGSGVDPRQPAEGGDACESERRHAAKVLERAPPSAGGRARGRPSGGPSGRTRRSPPGVGRAPRAGARGRGLPAPARRVPHSSARFHRGGCGGSAG